MNINLKKKNLISLFLLMLFGIGLFSISSCENNISLETVDDPNACHISIVPGFGDSSQSEDNSSRAALPDFSSFSFTGYTFKASSSVLANDINGTYDTSTGKISFNFSTSVFSEETDFTFYIYKSGEPVFYGTKKISYETIGSTIEKTVYFNSYNSSTVKGFIDLSLSTSEDYNITCTVTDSEENTVSGDSTSDMPIIISSGSNTCTLQTATGTDAGIAAGTYTAHIYVYRDGDTANVREYKEQKIYVWPGLTTYTWYLPNNTTATSYSIPVNKNKVTLYVKGTNPTGPYASGSGLTGVTNTGSDSTNKGTIKNPCITLQGAINKCLSSSTDYTIVVCGSVTGTATINASTVAAHSLVIQGAYGSQKDILNGNGSNTVLQVLGDISLTLKNIQLKNGSGSYGGGLSIRNGAKVTLENDALITENTASQKGGGVYVYGTQSKLTMNPGSKITKNYISATNNGANEYGGGGVYVGNNSYSDTTAELVLDGGEISEHELALEMRGAGVFATFAKVTLNSGKITKNKTTDIAANVMLQNYSKMTMSDGEISYGEINGTGDASAAGVWINGTAEFEMSGGKICNNTVKAKSGHVGRGAGVTAWQSNCKFTMTGGEISNNKVDSTSSNIIQGGAVCVYDTAKCYFKGDIKIPYGVDGLEGEGLNDIWIYNNNKINITGKITPTASGKNGYIKPQSYSEGTPVLTLAEDPSPATNLKREVEKFALIQNPSDSTTTWEIGMDGKLLKAVTLSFPTITGLSFNGNATLVADNDSSQTSSVFIAGRKLGLMKDIIASDHEVTQKEYEKYCKFGGNATHVPSNQYGLGDYYPAYYVSWYDAIVYCNLRSIADNLEPVYEVNGRIHPKQWPNYDGNETDGYCAPESCTWDVKIYGNRNGWRLPYEFEWEYLARDGNLSNSGQTIYSGSDTPSAVGNVPVSGPGKTKPVKSYAPTTNLNMYDMSGNVWEWVSDWWSTASTLKDVSSSGAKKSASNLNHVTKGGGWANSSNSDAWCTVKHRNSSSPNSRNNDMGFRVVRNAQYFGAKIPSDEKAVGDIVFNDGSATPYTNGMSLTTTQINNAAALIFYKGTGLNNSGTTERTLGVGLKHNRSGLYWCSNNANAKGINIETIQCTEDEGGSPGNYTFSSGALNGANNLKLIGIYLGTHESTDDTSDDNSAEKYPAFYYGKNYKNVTGSNVSGSACEDGWYLPSIAEILQIYVCREDNVNGFAIDIALEALGGDCFDSGEYWSSTQSESYLRARRIEFENGNIKQADLSKTNNGTYVCVIREF